MNKTSDLQQMIEVDNALDQLTIDQLIDFAKNNCDLWPELIEATELQILQYFVAGHKKLMKLIGEN